MTIDFKALQAPIPAGQVKTKTGQGNKKQSYITARTVMIRLDEVCGPENWRTEYKVRTGDSSKVECTLFIKVNGEWIGKADVGDESNFSPIKGAYSDAFKRAAVHWGIGRELYQEGTADLSDDENTPRHTDASIVHQMTDDNALNAAGEWCRSNADIRKLEAWLVKLWGIEGPHLWNRTRVAITGQKSGAEFESREDWQQWMIQNSPSKDALHTLCQIYEA